MRGVGRPVVARCVAVTPVLRIPCGMRRTDPCGILRRIPAPFPGAPRRARNSRSSPASRRAHHGHHDVDATRRHHLLPAGPPFGLPRRSRRAPHGTRARPLEPSHPSAGAARAHPVRAGAPWVPGARRAAAARGVAARRDGARPLAVTGDGRHGADAPRASRPLRHRARCAGSVAVRVVLIGRSRRGRPRRRRTSSRRRDRRCRCRRSRRASSPRGVRRASRSRR